MKLDLYDYAPVGLMHFFFLRKSPNFENSLFFSGTGNRKLNR